MELTGLGGAIVLFAIIGLILIGGAITAYVLFLVNLKRMLDQVNPDNRTVPPSNVFLMLIPIFSLIYAFILFPKISDALGKEYASRGMTLPGDGLRGLGYAFAGVSAFYAVLNYAIKTPFSGIVSLAALVIWIIYWVQSARIKNELMSSMSGSRADLLD